MKQLNNIRHYRVSKGYSQKYVATRLKKSQPLLSKIENGITHISDEVIDQLSKILEVSKEKLYHAENSIPDKESFNNKIFFNAEKELPDVNNMAITLINQLHQNKKLLHKVALNQEQLHQQLYALLSALTTKN
jgi:transcriptional regulator with XRE-family HTH domain